MNTLAIVDSFFSALEKGDLDTIAALYDENIEIWYNFTKTSQGKAHNINNVLRELRHFAQIKWNIDERVAAGDRVAQRHTMYMKGKDGHERYVPGAIFFHFRNDKIIGINEYYDSADVTPIFEYMAKYKASEGAA